MLQLLLTISYFRKAEIFMVALKAYMNTEILSPNYNALRASVNTGGILYRYIKDIAVLTRDLFRYVL